DAPTETAQIRVADNGVGIPEDDLASIFQVFSSSKGTRGTGLGLPVSQKIVREHGGQIFVTSEVGRGSQFLIELPQHRAGDLGDEDGQGPPT
ncbi:MAG: HAMP domain-containing sensor histidine kinase, partial [Isosphaeraceae bacterium]